MREKVFEDENVIHESEKKWRLKSRFLNQLKHIPGVSSYTIQELHKTNRAEFVIDGIKRIIEIEPKLHLEVNKE